MKPRHLILLLIAITACSQRKVKADSIDQEVNGVMVRARFMDPRTFPNETSASRLSEIAKGEYLYFNIQLQRPDFEPDKKTVSYLDFQLQNDFKMFADSDTLFPLLVHRIPNGRKEVYEYIVVFNGSMLEPEQNNSVGIVYDDKVFGLGRQIFQFNTQN